MPEKSDGFGALFGLVVSKARKGLQEDYPEAIKAFRPEVGSTDELHAVLSELAVTPRYLKALEAGWAYRDTISRIHEVHRVAGAIDLSSPVADGVQAILFDSMHIYVSAYIDGARNFAITSLGQLVSEDDDTRQRRTELMTWAGSAKRRLSNGRQAVAHADTPWINAINEDGLWAPMILGGIDEARLVEVYEETRAYNSRRFPWRMELLFRSAVLLLAQGEKQLGATAELIAKKTDASDS